MTDSDSNANDNTSNDEFDATSNDSSPDSQYLVTFKRNNHRETIINHTIDYKDLFTMQEQDYITDYIADSTGSEYEESTKSTHKKSEKKEPGQDEGLANYRKRYWIQRG
ncbi:5457_t:CDS:2 [Dentiscutata erythropus]|uniref:5457_t:CDS:1 n=1 Tax=Dentiscutata erythropus TaxID=1348616 RepID=A0A9N9NTH6_9GLOM|nr:5457_t:CDS:2 [Dentiscutata erythropus]